jgi:HK97 family phage portal protein
VVFAQTSGAIRSIASPSYVAPTTVRLSDDYTADYAEIYRQQGEVRVVVDFLARNIGQLALHTFRRVGDDDRRRETKHLLAQLIGRPNSFTTSDRLVRETVADRAIYDRCLWIKTFEKLPNGDRVRALVRIPPYMWRLDNGPETNWIKPERFIVQGNLREFTVPIEQTVYFRGYNPLDTRQGLSPIESLRRSLSESWAASIMREQTLRNGARFSGYIHRPKDAPKWNDNSERRFKTGWRNQFQGLTATEGGGTPVLEDGMTFVPASMTSEQLEYVATRKLTREEAAAAYFIPPPMIGILDHATFSNITEQHKMLYQDTLGPWLSEYEAEIQLQLVPDYNDEELYVEFNLKEKLKGSFAEEAKAFQTSVGAPWLTRNEARARNNLSPIDGGDDLIVPLNVTTEARAAEAAERAAELAANLPAIEPGEQDQEPAAGEPAAITAG